MVKLPLDWTFFGLTQSYNTQLYDEVFDLCYLSKGAFPYKDVWEMPVVIRKYYFKRLTYLLEMERQAQEAAAQQRSR